MAKEKASDLAPPNRMEKNNNDQRIFRIRSAYTSAISSRAWTLAARH